MYNYIFNYYLRILFINYFIKLMLEVTIDNIFLDLIDVFVIEHDCNFETQILNNLYTSIILNILKIK